jgi:hypothetical protein
MRGEVENRRAGRARDRGRARKRSREDIGGLQWGEGGKLLERSQTFKFIEWSRGLLYLPSSCGFVFVADYVHRLLRLCFIRL